MITVPFCVGASSEISGSCNALVEGSISAGACARPAAGLVVNLCPLAANLRALTVMPLDAQTRKANLDHNTALRDR